jgi:hypothetical protein
MARITEASLLAQNNPILTAILTGECSGALLEDIDHAMSIYKKKTFRPNTKVRLVGTRNPEIDGKIGVVIRANPKKIAVGLGEKQDWGGYEQEFGVPVRMLELVE